MFDVYEVPESRVSSCCWRHYCIALLSWQAVQSYMVYNLNKLFVNTTTDKWHRAGESFLCGNSMEQSAWRTDTLAGNAPHLIEHKGSSPFSPVPTTFACPEPDQCSPHSPSDPFCLRSVAALASRIYFFFFTKQSLVFFFFLSFPPTTSLCTFLFYSVHIP